MTMLRVLRQFFSVANTDYSDDEILHICGILYVNAHEVPVTANPSQAIFRSASLVEHSCVNNASKHFDMNCNIQVSIFALIFVGLVLKSQLKLLLLRRFVDK